MTNKNSTKYRNALAFLLVNFLTIQIFIANPLALVKPGSEPIKGFQISTLKDGSKVLIPDYSTTKCLLCDNVTNGGEIAGNEVGCANPLWDPGLISNVSFPSGGSGAIEYVWMYTTDDPNLPIILWNPVPNSNTPTLDPTPISVTTYYTRCSRRAGCTLYVGETNYVTKKIECCNNVTNGGTIGYDQSHCGSSYDPALLVNVTSPSGGGTDTLQYIWKYSHTGGPVDSTWITIVGADTAIYNPSLITQTTYYVRLVRQASCVDYLNSNIVKITLNPTVVISDVKVTNIPCYGTNTGSIQLTVTGGTPPFSYHWSNGLPDEPDQHNLYAGTYSVTVTDKNGCSDNATAIINQLDSIKITQTHQNINCFGAGNGSINITVTGGNGPYTYLWSNGATTEDLTNLNPGTYSVTVTDKNLCTKSLNGIVITQPSELILSATFINPKCNGSTNGSINLTVTGGTPAYSYNWDNAPDVEDPTGLGAGNYTVTVTDALGCTKSLSVTLSEPPPININITINNVKCNGGSDGSVNLTVTGGTPAYSFNWDNAPDVEDPSGLTAGTYHVTVTDANGCTKTATATITEPPVLNINVVTTDVKCNGGSDGSINLTVTGGTPAYTYNWDNAPDVEDPTGLVAGTYHVTVTDSNGCTKTATATISQPTAIVITGVVTNIKCNGGNTGAINITVTGGSPTYTYLWSNGATTEDITGLVAGSYTVTVTDVKGCTKTQNFTITQPDVLFLSLTVINNKCNGGNTGSIDLTVTGGTIPYTYLWSNGATVEDPTGLIAGFYHVTVTDANGCFKSISTFISEPPAIVLSVVVNNVKCPGANDGSINLTVTGGTSPYTYVWSNGAVTEDISGLVAGTYTVTVTDANACTKTISANVTQPNPINISATHTDVKCNGGNTGTIDLTVTGGTPTYTYNWDNAPDVEDPTGLTAGTYHVTVTDANGCTAISTVIINETSSILLSVTTKNVKCNGGKDGSIDLTVTGGKTPYTYNWDNAPDVEDPSGLATGTYTVTVTDANGCNKIIQATITEPTSIVLSVDVTNIKCNGAKNGSIELTVTGGTPGYTFNWDNAPDVEDPSGLAAGTYTVTVTDANACTKTITATITQPTELVLAMTISDVQCYGGNDGQINLFVSGGTPPYSFDWDNAPDVQSPSGLSAGTYKVTVSDANGCTKTAQATIGQPNPIVLTAIVNDVKCNGSTTGSINLTVTGGTPAYTYNWDNAPDIEDPSGLSAGTYHVTVTDGHGCTQTTTVVVKEPTALQLSVSVSNVNCNGGNNGSINLTVAGGVPPYSYNWDNAPDIEDPSGLKAGTYTVTVTDANNCTKTISATITEPAPIVLSVKVTNAKCKGSKDGSIDLTVSGGTPGYTFDWDNAPDVEDPSGLAAGTYKVTVTDSKGCTKTISATITEPLQIQLTVSSTPVKCHDGNDGSINLTVFGGTAPYTYNWDNAPDVEDPTGLTPGTYNVTVTDANGCTATTNTTIANPPGISVKFVVKNVSCYGDKNGSINLTVTGGSGIYTYNWDNAPDVEDPSGLGVGIYTVTITDNNACTTVVVVEVKGPDKLKITSVTKPSTCVNGNDGGIDITVTGGTAPYTYKWSNGSIAEDQTGLTPGNYQVTVTDSKGCKETLFVILGSSGINCVNIGNYVWLDGNCNGIQENNEMGVNGVKVVLIDVGPDMILGTADDKMVDMKVTQNNGVTKGYYVFENVPPGKYSVMFMPDLAIYKYTLKDQGSDDELDSDADKVTGKTPVIMVNNGDKDNYSLDAGLCLICDNITNAGVIGYDEILCGPGKKASTIVNVQLPSGGSGTIEYVWMYSTTDPNFYPNNPDWYPVSNSNSPSIEPGILYQTTYYVRCARRENCTIYTGESNVVTKEVLIDLPVAEIIEKPLGPLCKKDYANFTALHNNLPDIQYKWYLGPDAVPNTVIGESASTYWTVPGYKTVTLTVTEKGACSSTASWVVQVLDCNGGKIKIVNFDATANLDHTATLIWKTISIANAHTLTVQRSADGKNFVDIYQQDGQLNYVGWYSFIDKNPIQNIGYYRILITENNGEIALSKTKRVDLNNSNDDQVLVYPNPFTNYIEIEHSRAPKEDVLLELYDYVGKKLYAKTSSYAKDYIEFKDLTVGTYLLLIKDKDGKVISSNKLIKQVE